MNAPVFFSQMEHYLTTGNRGNSPLLKFGTGPEFNAQIKSMIQAGHFKQAEYDWLDLGQWLATQKGQITRDRVLTFIRENGVQVQEILLPHEKDPEASIEWKQVNDKTWQGHSQANEFILKAVEAGSRWQLFQYDAVMGVFDSREEAEAEAVKLAKGWMGVGYPDYVLPGGRNYRELLLTLPYSTGLTPTENAVYNRLNELNEVGAIRSDSAHMRRFLQLKEKVLDYGDATFVSSHYDVPNILGHIRFTEREHEGKRILFLEELQSDWHAAGREHGYIESMNRAFRWRLASLRAEQDQLIAEGRFNMGDPAHTAFSQKSRPLYAEMDDHRESLREQAEMLVPEAPFKNNTWITLLLKRMLRYAAENGFDGIAMTSGQQQIDRYDLSKQIDQIDYWKNDTGHYGFAAFQDDEVKIKRHSLTAEAMEEYFGKDITGKIVAAAQKEPTGALYTLDLQVGGDGMRAFYDQIVPNTANALFRKLGGGRLAPVEMQFGTARYTVPMIEMGPTMRDFVMQGQPLFSRSRTAFGVAQLDLLQKRADKMLGADTNIVRFAKRLFDTAGNPVSGKYERDTVTVALNARDAMGSLNHEVMHHAMATLLSESEIKALMETFRPDGEMANRVQQALIADGEGKIAHNKRYLDKQELIAFGFQYWAQGKLSFPNNPEGRQATGIFVKLAALFDRVKNWLEGNGFTTPESVFNALDAGRLAPREATRQRQQEMDIGISNDLVAAATAAYNRQTDKDGPENDQDSPDDGIEATLKI